MPIKVFSKAAQKVVEVPSSEAQRGLLAGDYVAPEGQQLRVAKGTKTGRVAPADLLVALGQGARLVDEAEVEKLTIKREESDVPSQALAALEAGAAGASLGLSTALEAALGVDPERMAARREAADFVATGAELGGAIASGGAGLAAKSGVAAAKYGAGALVSRGARGLERMVGKELAETGAGGVVRTAVPAAIGQTAEGIGYAAGAELDESVLGKRPIAAEHILGGGLMSGALGGVLGIAAPGMQKVIEGTGKLPAAAARRVGGAIGSVEMPKNFGEVAEFGARKIAKATGGDEKQLVELAGYASTPEKIARAYRVIHDREGVLREMTDEVHGAVTEVSDALGTVVPELSRASKLKHVERKLPKDGNDAIRIDEARKVLQDYESTLRGMSAANAEVRYTRYNQGDIEKALAHASKARADIEDAAASLPGRQPSAGTVDIRTGRRIEPRPTKTAADAYRALDVLKQTIDESNAARNLFSKTDAQIADTFSAMSGAQARLRKHLEDEAIWGAAGAAQRRINAKVTASMVAKQELGARTSVLGRVMDRSKETAPSDILALVKKGGLKGDEQRAKMLNYLEVELDYMRTARELFDLEPSQLVKINAAEKAVERFIKTLEKRAEDARLLDLDAYARHLESSGSPSMTIYSTVGPKIASSIGSAVTAGVGAMVGGLPGAIAGHALGDVAGTLVGSITRPHTSFRTLIALAHKANKHGMDLDAAVGRFLGRMRSAGQRADGYSAKIERGAKKAGEFAASSTRSVGRAAGRAAAVASSKPETKAEKVSRLTKLRSRVLDLATRPGKIADELRLPLSHISDHAPMLADLVASKVQVAAEFLASKVPAVYEPPFGNGKPIVNTVEQAKWERYVAVVENPLIVADLLNEGNLTREHVEALFHVYPEIHKSIVDSVWAEFAAARAEGRTVPFKARIKAATLLDLPTDPVYTPEVLAAVQNVWAPTQSELAMASPSSSSRSSKSSTRSESATTPAQKTEV